MPPRFRYWTVVIDGVPTAFRANESRGARAHAPSASAPGAWGHLDVVRERATVAVARRSSGRSRTKPTSSPAERSRSHEQTVGAAWCVPASSGPFSPSQTLTTRPETDCRWFFTLSFSRSDRSCRTSSVARSSTHGRTRSRRFRRYAGRRSAGVSGTAADMRASMAEDMEYGAVIEFDDIAGLQTYLGSLRA